MPRVPAWLDRYRALPRGVILFAVGQFFINLIQTAQFLLLNLFLKDSGMDDPSIAALTSQRFVATFFLAIPAGLWLRGRPLRWPLILGATLFPLMALASLETVRCGAMTAASACFVIMGFASLILNVANLPMALRLVPAHQSSEAISLLFSTWAAASICGGLVSSVLQGIGHFDVSGLHLVFDEHSTLLVLTLVGFVAPLFFAWMPDPSPESKPSHHWLHVHRSDMPVLLHTLLPTLCVATGAGLSIQFINLFFHSVFQLDPARYSAYGSASNVLVLIASLIVPEIRRRFGWWGVIVGVQSIAILVLAIMGFTELWKHAAWALPVAVVCFIVRQPLMSMTAPSISELTMTYVGERNRELMSACNGAVWSGSWWLAARMFQLLRSHQTPYWMIFLITAILYLIGTWFYLHIIRNVVRREAQTQPPHKHQ